MTDDEIDGIIAWVIERGLVGASEIELLHEFCERSVAAGLALSSAMAVIDTLHPIWEGRAFLWSSDGTEGEVGRRIRELERRRKRRTMGAQRVLPQVESHRTP